MRLEQMYRRVGYEGFELVKAEHDTWMEAQYTDGSNEELYQPLSDSPLAMELDDESWKACCEIVAEYADSIPRWILCGETAAHTGLCKARWEDDQVQEAQAAAVKFLPEGLAIPHVAPDAPCPCGSGLRYCHCHGKYLS